MDAELSFNSDHFYKNFIPELTRLLDQIAASKKRFVYKDKNAVADIRSLRDKKSVPNRGQSLFHRYAINEFKKFQILVPENLDKFAYTLYSFRDELIPQVVGNNGILSDYIDRALTVKGVMLRFLDKGGEEVSYQEQPVSFRYLLNKDKNFKENEFAFHPSILKFSPMITNYDESIVHKFAIKFDMPKEILNTVKNVKIEFMVER